MDGRATPATVHWHAAWRQINPLWRSERLIQAVLACLYRLYVD